MCIAEQPIARGVLWHLEGLLSYEANALLRRHLAHLSETSREVVIDLADVTMIDAAGVGALVTVFRACEARRIALWLIRVPVRVRRILTIVQLADVLPMRI